MFRTALSGEIVAGALGNDPWKNWSTCCVIGVRRPSLASVTVTICLLACLHILRERNETTRSYSCLRPRGGILCRWLYRITLYEKRGGEAANPHSDNLGNRCLCCLSESTGSIANDAEFLR